MATTSGGDAIASLVDRNGNDLREAIARAEVRWANVEEAKLSAEEQKPSRHLASTTSIDGDLNYPIASLNPEKFVSALLDADDGHLEMWCELCEEMEDRDGQIAGMLATRRAAVIACDQDITPWRSHEAVITDRDAEPKDAEVANFCREQILGLLDWEDREVDLLDAGSKGCAFLNSEFKPFPGPRKKNRNYYLKALHHVPQRKMTFYGCDAANPRMLTEDEPVDGVPIQRNEWVVHAPRIRSIDPWRNGLMRVLGWYFMFKHFDMGNWLKFLETHAHPLRIGLYSPGISEASKRAIWYAIKRMSTDQAALVQADENGESPIKVQYPETKQASDSFKMLLDYCDQEIKVTILGQTLTSGTDGKGSNALGKVHDKVRHTYLAQDADQLAATIRRDLIAPLVVLNYGREYLARLPSLSIDYALPEDKLNEAQALGALSRDVGMTFSKRFIHKKFGTRAPDGPDDVAEFRPAGGGPVAGPPIGDDDKPAPDDKDAKKDKPAAEKKAKEGDRPNPTPAAMVAAIGMDLPAPVATAATEYAAVVDGTNKLVMSNTLENVTKYLAKRDKPWASGEAFAADFTKWWESKWWSFYGDEGISKGTLYPFLNKMYAHYKTVDLTAFPAGTSYRFTMGAPDQRVIDFMTRSDRWYFSKFVDNASFRGPMQQFLLDEYAERGGKLFGTMNEKVIEGFKKAAVKTTHNLSKYEVERVIRSTVNRARNWARIEQFGEAGILRGEIVNGPNPCPYCASLNGAVFEVANARSWIDNAMSLDDEGFRSLLDSRTTGHREAFAAGAGQQAQLEAAGWAPPWHTSCEDTVVMYVG